MRKIGIIDHVGIKSGMDIYDVSLANKLAKNCKVFVLSNFKNTKNQYLDVRINNTFNINDDGDSVINKSKYFFKGFLKSFFFLKKNKCNEIIIHSFSFEPKDLVIALISKIMGFKLLLIVHDVSGFAKKDSLYVKYIILNYLTHRILVHNEFSKNELLKQNVNPLKVVIIRHGGYIDFVNSSIARNEAFFDLKLDPNLKYILFFGQIKDVKGLDLLIKAFSKILDTKVKLIIAGKPWKDNFSTYENLIESKGLKSRIVLLKRYITDEEKDKLFLASDIVVIPYKKIFQSGVLLTALSYPCVVLCSDLEPNMEVIKSGENGFLFETNNIDSLASMLTFILNENSEKIKQIKDNALKTVKTDYSWDYAAEIIIKNLTND